MGKSAHETASGDHLPRTVFDQPVFGSDLHTNLAYFSATHIFGKKLEKENYWITKRSEKIRRTSKRMHIRVCYSYK